jgi:N-terminal domain of anti-restriction factor ArdC/IrrE N-terminal-like domain
MPPTTSLTIDRTKARAELLVALEEHIVELRSSERWLAYLNAQRQFHSYSPRNVMLIAMQHPEATHVAGFTTWKKFGRHVKRNEKAISILAPILIRKELDAEQRLTGFRWVNVFDISQTDGDPLPSPIQLLDEEAPDLFEDLLHRVVARTGFRLSYVPLAHGVNGECRWATKTIAIELRNPPAQRIKTIVHELAHALLHREATNRAVAEIEAESVAFVVLGACGLDAAPYSAGYVASWIGDDTDPAQAINASCDAIQRTAELILGLLERSANAHLGHASAETH